VVAQSGHLAIQSREAAVMHPDLGLLLALEAGHMRQSVETRGALLGALEQSIRLVGQLQGLTAPPSVVSFSPDGMLMASVGVDGTTVWDVRTRRATGTPLRSAQGGWEGADYSPDGRLLAIGGQRGIVELWDIASRRELRELKTPPGAALQDVGFSPDGKVLAASGREDNHVTLFDVTTGRALGAPIAPHAPGTSAGRFAFSRDSKLILLQTEMGLRFWTVANGRPAPTPFAAGDGPTRAQTFSRDGRELAGVDDSGSVSMWDTRTGARIGEAISVGEENVTSVDLSPDARLIAAGTESGRVLVWDARTGTPYGMPLIADAASVWDLEFSPDGRLLGTVHGRSVALWDMTGEQAIGHPLGAIGDVATDVAFQPDGKQLAMGRFDSSIGIFDATTRRELAHIPVGSIVYSVRYSPDGRLIAAGSIDGKVRFWDATTRAPAGPPLDTGPAFVWQIAFSPDGRLLAAAVDPNGPRNIYEPDRQGEAQLWNVASRRRVGKSMVPGKHSILSVAFSPDGKVLATGSFEERTELWNVGDQTPLGKPMDLKEDGVAVVAFAPDGRRVVAAGIGVRIWNEVTQQLALPPLAVGADPVAGAAYDPSGRFLATTSLASATRLWDPTTGLAYGDDLSAAPRPASLQPSVDVPLFPPVRNAFSPDGRYLVTAGVMARAMIWDLDLATWRARACEIAGRNLTREEWRVYLPSGARYRTTCAQWPAA
jgi:WD40 repeat protein